MSTLVYRNIWEKLEYTSPRPNRFRNLITLSYEEFKYRVENNIAVSMINSLYSGDAYLIKNGFPQDFMFRLQQEVHDYCKEHPSEFHKMLEGTPDFHRQIDLETGKNYSIASCKHSCYFYRWNNDPLNVYETIDERWRILKVLMGLQYNEYENNTPKDGVVDRIQVVRYPPSLGYLEPHTDAFEHQRLIFSGYMSKRGLDYNGGGFYLINGENKVINIEDKIDVGDFLFCYASVYHGVAPCEGECDWDKDNGRWFLSMYSNTSDEVENRFTAAPVKLDIPEVLPIEVR